MLTQHSIDRKISIAPMMAWTDRHFRAFLRTITRHTLLYTEMVTTPAVIHGDCEKLLGFNEIEHPLALQLGGCDPKALAKCAKLAEAMGYDEVNLNVGCPSDRVQAARFGACLMKEPELVAECIASMQSSVKIPVTVKSRTGVDAFDQEDYLFAFADTLVSAGLKTLIVHARKAWLQGLNPKQNRDIPPLHYDRVYRLKQAFPDLTVIINGGIRTIEAMTEHLQHVDGVMIGRAAYQAPQCLTTVDRDIFLANSALQSEKQWVLSYIPYITSELAKGVPLQHMTKHLHGLFAGKPGARQWRRYLSENAYKNRADEQVVLRALTALNLLDDVI